MKGLNRCGLVEESVCLELGWEEGSALIKIFCGDVMTYSATFVENKTIIILNCAFPLDVPSIIELVE